MAFTFQKKLSPFLIGWGVFFLLFFIFYHKIEIKNCHVIYNNSKKSISLPYSYRSEGKREYIYECDINSNTNQDVVLGIAVDDILEKIILNGKELDLYSLQTRYNQKKLKDWYRGYIFHIKMKKGNNKLRIVSYDQGGRYGLKIAQSYDISEYLLLFFFGVVPIVIGFYNIFFHKIIDFEYNTIFLKMSGKHLAIVIILIGILLRVYYVYHIPNWKYQHDFKGHIETIQYYANHPFLLPQPDKGLEYPQQILYYEIAGLIYSLAEKIDLNKEEIISLLRILSLFFSIVWLLLAYAISKIYLKNWLGRNIFLAFMAFTPSFIILSGAVNNDALNALLGLWALYEIALYFLFGKRRDFYLSLVAILLASLTKISSLLLAVYFFIVLLVLYYKKLEWRSRLKTDILIFGLSVLFLFGFSLLKVYIPTIGEFKFVNSGLFANQVIPYLDLNYFFSFHWFELIKEGASYVFGNKNITHSLPTYLYGTMFVGEFNFIKLFKAGDLFKLFSQMIFLLGIVYVVGFIYYLYSFRQERLLYQLLIVPVVINLLLIIKFLSQYWVICNSDFRYFTSVFGAIGLIFTIGLNSLMQRYPILKKMTIWCITILSTVEILWILKL